MMTKARLKGGKTAPRLLQDLYSYDPRRIPPNGYNVLTDVLYHDEEKESQHPPLPPRGACEHTWCLKRNQCNLLADGVYRADWLAPWRISCYCSKCRCHLQLLMRYRFQEDSLPCPTVKRPLHHFMHRPDASEAWHEDSYGENDFAWVDKQAFECSAPHCSAQLVIQFMPPRLTVEWVNQLTNPREIKARAEKAMASDPVRYEGIAVPGPGLVLEYLKSYINDALSGRTKKIQGNNKKWSLSLGEECAPLLHYLGFTQEGDDWHLPMPESNAEVPFQNMLNMLLDDVRKELHVLMFLRPDDERRGAKISYDQEWAINELRVALGCIDYKKSLRSRTVDLTINEHPCYAGLGAVSDFHDDLVALAYDWQILSDFQHSPYYLECLQTLSDGRQSEDLQTKAAIEASQGKISLKDVRNAYKDLGVDSTLSDDTIIGCFQARLADAPRQETDLRRDLNIIGQIRESRKIQLVASQAVTTYEQALLFLSATDEMNDEFIISMFSLKVNERQTDERNARQAVALIANHRKSQNLKNWLDTGFLGEAEMDPSSAYALLDISDRTIDDPTILVAYNVAAEESPAQADELKRALTALAKSRDSRLLKSRLGMEIEMDDSKHSLSEWPVGIENIGNTCYLNSLLQFYFTIKPLRGLVLDIDKFKMPIDDESITTKRVGSRNVSRKEVDRAQRTVDELKRLFQGLITSPKPSLKPDAEVARLTLLSSSKAEQARRHSILNTERPSIAAPLGTLGDMPIQGPPTAPSADASMEAVQADTEMLDSDFTRENAATEEENSNTSSETLVNGPAATEVLTAQEVAEKRQQQNILDNKENLPPPNVPDGSQTENHLSPLTESSPSRLNEQPIQNADQHEVKEIIDLSAVDTFRRAPNGPPPNRPPPIPPRPKPAVNDALKEAEYGAQQDVNEVIGNVLFQLQCAIKPESVDETGEQLDQVKRLFFGKQKSYTTNKLGVIRTKEEYMSDIKVDVASGSRDIYEALDGAYDVQDVEVAGGIEPQYSTISQLPPVLQVLIQRAQFDPQTKTTFKSNNHLILREIIYMDRYMDSTEPELLRRRQECWDWKRKLCELEKRKQQFNAPEMGMDMSEVLDATHTYLRQLGKFKGKSSIEVPSRLMRAIESHANAAKAELGSIESKIKDLNTNISSQFSDLRQIPYRLAAVFIHVGSHVTGHYWIYIYDFKAKLWRKYNDEKVTEVEDIKEIFEADPGARPPTPYFLVYVKDEQKEELVDPVCREVVDPPSEERRDIEMGEGSYVEIPTADSIDNVYRAINPDRNTMMEEARATTPFQDREGNQASTPPKKPATEDATLPP